MTKLSLVKAGKRSVGQKHLVSHLEGRKLTHKKAILAMCYDCMGYYKDGLRDCGIPECPLYPFSPYRKDKE